MMASQAWNLRPYRRLFCLLWFMNGFAVDYPPRLQHSSSDRQAEEISQDNRQLLLWGSKGGRCVLIQVCNSICKFQLDTTGKWILIMWHPTQRQAGSAGVLIIFFGPQSFCSFCNTVFSQVFLSGLWHKSAHCSQIRKGNILIQPCACSSKIILLSCSHKVYCLVWEMDRLCSSPGYSKEICFLWFIAKNRHSWPHKRRFLCFSFPFPARQFVPSHC